ncbi:RelA/SpoT family protein [Cryptosporangium aurantiacum]|uniref:GTP pyrophosphokinase n=1 Tax=Cryptosporangium aurantiacum TaxID=134849 RepID=A0A1M7QUW4_9ACTN|nr:RelA/SpoT family protein [Cryptosporangium aurantiacum]SHN35668.1 GTP pyrophosphokinase [Cryptosporangium aurantiacum]
MARRALRALLRAGAVAAPGRNRQNDPLANLLALHREAHPKADVEVLRRAYTIAERAHRGQMRKSGEPYITHPLAVTEICAELGMDTTALVAAILHDTVEDTQYTLDQLRADFGDEVALLVDGLTKLDKVRFGTAAAEAETNRKMIITAGRDPRVLVIKLADRVHNMRTLGFKSGPSQQRIARATNEVLIPLAGRLGIHKIKRELEDLVFRILQPDAYAEVERRLEARMAERTVYLDGLVQEAAAELKAARIKATITWRERHRKSVWKQINKTPNAPDDFIGADRLVVVIDGDPTECYAALGVIHGRWHPMPGRFKDHIGVPKFNMYQSLHTTVIAPEGRCDVLIRTEGMNRVAEYGIAALHRFGRDRVGDAAAELEWLQRVLDWQEDAAEPGEFMDSLRSGLSDHEVLVFTPSGRAISLPEDGTPVDFAYAVSTRLGDRCIGSKVNGQLVPLARPLSDGDVVEVLTSPSEYAGPSEEWLTFAKSPQAQIHIRRWFAEDVSDASVEDGRRDIAAALAAEGRVLAHDRPLSMLARVLDLPDHDSLCAAVADGRLDPTDVARRLILIVDGPGED